MKAFVIKNKEGKYKAPDIGYEMETPYYNDLSSAELFDTYDFAKCYCPNDCQIVEITIAEENLEQKIAVLERALEEMYDDLSDACSSLPPYEWYIQQAEKELKGEKDE